jgi:energy-coupling factor transport system ATP-binding protein
VFALDGVDVEFRAGERVAIMGPNGSGKSTLLQGLAGHLPVGKLVGQATVVDVPQDPDLALFCETTEAELAYGPKERRLDPAAVLRAVHGTAAGLDLLPLLHRPPQALSRGQRLRTAVGAALCCDPDVLLLDEPTSGQDRTQVARMMATLATVEAHRTVVFATHDEELATQHATRIIRLESGRVVTPVGGA